MCSSLSFGVGGPCPRWPLLCLCRAACRDTIAPRSGCRPDRTLSLGHVFGHSDIRPRTTCRQATGTRRGRAASYFSIILSKTSRRATGTRPGLRLHSNSIHLCRFRRYSLCILHNLAAGHLWNYRCRLSRQAKTQCRGRDICHFSTDLHISAQICIRICRGHWLCFIIIGLRIYLRLRGLWDPSHAFFHCASFLYRLRHLAMSAHRSHVSCQDVTTHYKPCRSLIIILGWDPPHLSQSYERVQKY